MSKNNKGTLFWVTGLSGSGKTQIAKKILPKVIKNYGPTILLSGDDLRKIFNLKDYSYEGRFETVMKYCKLSKFITSQNINVILAVIGMRHGLRDWNHKNIKNYIKIYIKADIKTIIDQGKKRIYHQNEKNIVGIDVKFEYPKKPHITLHNNFKKSIDSYSNDLMIKINKQLS